MLFIESEPKSKPELSTIFSARHPLFSGIGDTHYNMHAAASVRPPQYLPWSFNGQEPFKSPEDKNRYKGNAPLSVFGKIQEYAVPLSKFKKRQFRIIEAKYGVFFFCVC